VATINSCSGSLRIQIGTHLLLVSQARSVAELCFNWLGIRSEDLNSQLMDPWCWHLTSGYKSSKSTKSHLKFPLNTYLLKIVCLSSFRSLWPLNHETLFCHHNFFRWFGHCPGFYFLGTNNIMWILGTELKFTTLIILFSRWVLKYLNSVIRFEQHYQDWEHLV